MLELNISLLVRNDGIHSLIELDGNPIYAEVHREESCREQSATRALGFAQTRLTALGAIIHSFEVGAFGLGTMVPNDPGFLATFSFNPLENIEQNNRAVFQCFAILGEVFPGSQALQEELLAIEAVSSSDSLVNQNDP